MTIQKVKDNSFKLILGEPELFVEFLNDFAEHPLKLSVDVITVLLKRIKVPDNETETITD